MRDISDSNSSHENELSNKQIRHRKIPDVELLPHSGDGLVEFQPLRVLQIVLPSYLAGRLEPIHYGTVPSETF